MDNLWGIHVPTGELSQLTFGGGKHWNPSVSADGRITYTAWSHRTDLYRVNLSTRESEQLTAYTQDNGIGTATASCTRRSPTRGSSCGRRT